MNTHTHTHRKSESWKYMHIYMHGHRHIYMYMYVYTHTFTHNIFPVLYIIQQISMYFWSHSFCEFYSDSLKSFIHSINTNSCMERRDCCTLMPVNNDNPCLYDLLHTCLVRYCRIVAWLVQIILKLTVLHRTQLIKSQIS